MHLSRWAWGLLAGIAGCATGGPGAGGTPAGAGAPAADGPAEKEEMFIDDDGTVRPWHGPVVNQIDRPDNLARIRCSVSTDGEIYGCVLLSGPRSVEDRLAEALHRVRVEPVRNEEGKPIEVLRTFTFRVTFVGL
jgi:hypothetical protein